MKISVPSNQGVIEGAKAKDKLRSYFEENTKYNHSLCNSGSTKVKSIYDVPRINEL